MINLADKILCGLPADDFLVAYLYAVLGLILKVLISATTRLTLKPVRKIRYDVFFIRVAMALITSFVIVTQCKYIFGVTISTTLSFCSGLVFDLSIEKLLTFAKALINPQNLTTMDERLEYVFSPILSENDKVESPLTGETLQTGDFARQTSATLSPVESNPDQFELVYSDVPLFEKLKFIEPGGGVYFVGHVPRRPKVVDSE